VQVAQTAVADAAKQMATMAFFMTDSLRVLIFGYIDAEGLACDVTKGLRLAYCLHKIGFVTVGDFVNALLCCQGVLL
jgi:hypothetical protein